MRNIFITILVLMFVSCRMPFVDGYSHQVQVKETCYLPEYVSDYNDEIFGYCWEVHYNDIKKMYVVPMDCLKSYKNENKIIFLYDYSKYTKEQLMSTPIFFVN